MKYNFVWLWQHIINGIWSKDGYQTTIIFSTYTIIILLVYVTVLFCINFNIFVSHKQMNNYFRFVRNISNKKSNCIKEQITSEKAVQLKFLKSYEFLVVKIMLELKWKCQYICNFKIDILASFAYWFNLRIVLPQPCKSNLNPGTQIWSFILFSLLKETRVA